LEKTVSFLVSREVWKRRYSNMTYYERRRRMKRVRRGSRGADWI
jgi:pilus assembly protein TadC